MFCQMNTNANGMNLPADLAQGRWWLSVKQEQFL
jgi:hypothetical protein